MAVLVVLTPRPATADHFAGATGSTASCHVGYSGGINQTDDYYWYWEYIGLTNEVAGALEFARIYHYEPIGMVISGYPNDDMVALDEDFVDWCGEYWDDPYDNLLGMTICDVKWPSGSWAAQRCNRHVVWFDLGDTAWMNTDQERAVACHELGHAVGLRHRPHVGDPYYDGCMDTYFPIPNYLSDHDFWAVYWGY